MSLSKPSPKMRLLFLLSILLMAGHKIESYQTHEWDYAPAYQYFLGLGFEKGEILFLTFVSMLFFGLLWSVCIIFWRNGQWLLLTIWGLTFVLELHHILRSLLANAYYSGVYTAILYALFGVLYWREFLRHLHFHTPATRQRKQSGV